MKELTDSELYEMLVNGIEPEGVEKVTDEEAQEFIEILENMFKEDGAETKRCPCQNREEINKRLNK